MDARASIAHRTIIDTCAANVACFQEPDRKEDVYFRLDEMRRASFRAKPICRLSLSPPFAKHWYLLIEERGIGRSRGYPTVGEIANHRDPRARLFAFDRRGVDRQQIWLSFSRGLHVRRVGLNMLARRGRKQPPK
jgi:hypothetical protein